MTKHASPVYTGKHRFSQVSNYERAVWSGAWTLIAAGVIVILALGIHPMGANAQTVTRTPTQVAANDFAAWQQHETTPNLMRLVHDAYRLPGYGKAGTASDILQLAADEAGGAKAKYISDDVEYLRDDFGGAN